MWFDIIRIILSVAGGLGIVYIGILVLRTLSQKQPDPPPPGEMRKVKLNFVCSICSSEVQMKVAPVEEPAPPKHCGEEMSLVAPVEE